MLSRIEALRADLRKSERRVADFVIAKPTTAMSLSIAAIASQAGVSQPTVARFCRALGCSGFKDFKLKLAQSMAAGVPYVHSDVLPHDPPAEMAAKIFDKTIATLINVRTHLDAVAIEKAIGLLANARKIEFYGLGNSGITAADAQHKFFRLGVNTVAYADPHVHGMAATMLAPGDAVVAISNTGRTIDLLRSVEIARESGAEVVGITHSGSPLARLCSVALYADVAEDPDVYSPMTSRIAHLALVDVLAVGVALRRGPPLLSQLERTKKSLRERRVRGYE